MDGCTSFFPSFLGIRSFYQMLCAFATTHRSLMLISEASRDHKEVSFFQKKKK